jgi:hypothetical protein
MNILLWFLVAVIAFLSTRAFINWGKFWPSIDRYQAIFFVVHFLVAAVLVWAALSNYSLIAEFDSKGAGIAATVISTIALVASILYVHLYKSPNAGELKPFNQSEKFDR